MVDPSTIADPELAKARRVAAQFAQAVRARLGAHLRDIRLFGSAARDDWTAESDVDVLVLLDPLSRTDASEISELALQIGILSSDILLRPLILDVAAFQHLRRRERRLALDIEREGVPL